MTNLYYDNSTSGFYSQEAANGIFTSAMTRLYGWISLGVVTHRGRSAGSATRPAP